MKIIFEGDEIREIVEAYRAEYDPDNDVPYADLVETLTTYNQNFRELLIDIASLRLSLESCKYVDYSAMISKLHKVREEENVSHFTPVIKNISLMRGSADLVIELLRFNE